MDYDYKLLFEEINKLIELGKKFDILYNEHGPYILLTHDSSVTVIYFSPNRRESSIMPIILINQLAISTFMFFVKTDINNDFFTNKLDIYKYYLSSDIKDYYKFNTCILKKVYTVRVIIIIKNSSYI